MQLERSHRVALRAALFQTLLHIVPVEEEELVAIRIVEDSSQRELERDGKDVPHEGDSFPLLPAELFRQCSGCDARRALAPEHQFLLLRHCKLRMNLKHAGRIDAETSEEIARLASVLVCPAEPLPHHCGLHTRHLFDLLPVGRRQGLGQRHPVMRHEPQRLSRRRITAEEQRSIHRHQNPEQTQRDRHAADRKDAAAPVAQAVLKDERGIPEHDHDRTPERKLFFFITL